MNRSVVCIGLSLLWIAGCRAPERNAAPEEHSQPAREAVPGRLDLVHAPQRISVQILLNPERCSGLGGPLHDEFDVAPNGAIIVANQNGLLELTAGPEGVEADRLVERPPDSFTLDGQGTILTIAQQYLGQFAGSEMSKVVPLPSAGMRLMGSTLPKTVYALANEEPESHRVYAFFADGTLQIEAEIPEPVVAVADNDAAVYLASKHNLFRVTPNGVTIVARLPETLGDIVSIAAAPPLMRRLALFTPNGWALRGITDLGTGARGAVLFWQPFLAILAFTVVIGGVAALLERRIVDQ